MSLFDEFTDDPEAGAFNSANQVITQIRDIFKTTQQIGDLARAANDLHAGAYGAQITTIDQWTQQAESSLAAATFQFNSVPGLDTSRTTAAQPLMDLLREQAGRLPDHIHSRLANTDPGDQRKSLALGVIESAKSTHDTLSIVIRIIHRRSVTNPVQQSLGSIVRHSIKMLEATLSTLEYACRIPTVSQKTNVPQGVTRSYDVFICHASEDKDDVVRELATLLRESGLEVWYDEWAMTIGDNLSQKISEGLSQSKFGVVVISPYFPSKQWQQQEFYALLSQHTAGQINILPIWHNITQENIANTNTIVANLIAADTAKHSTRGIGDMIISKVVVSDDVSQSSHPSKESVNRDTGAIQRDARNLLKQAASNDSHSLEKFQSGRVRYILAGPMPFGVGGDDVEWDRWDTALRWLWDQEFVRCVQADHTGIRFLVTEAGHNFEGAP